MKSFDEKNHIYSSVSNNLLSCIEYGAAWLYCKESEEHLEYWFKKYLQNVVNFAYKNFGIEPQKE